MEEEFSESDDENIIEDDVFTNCEKVALRNAWRVIDRRILYHNDRLYVSFYTEHETFLEYFRNSEQKIDVEDILNNGKNIMSIFNNIVSEGLVVSALRLMLREVYIHYARRKFPKIVVMTFVEVLVEYMRIEIKEIMTPTLDQALDKLVVLIITHYPTESKRSTAAQTKLSIKETETEN
ncbi:uncharacterized protein LOC119685010 [Teleopsis dalmanni]|uniref:uncharacterized protein LOC119675701 n=1 Tax=Teleopsis dalmanni TaxID=139649 RepID=UPI0018CCDB48|nr:uncharacterized protein LOC119675701 [Teleopsis dalmanni]XP_037955104.1 uncharacterized protein LOC119685010 [Teleopsis dalmanni]